MSQLYNLDFIIEITNGKQEKINMILEKFLLDAPVSVKNLDSSFRQKKMDNLKREAHSIKPIFRSVGADAAIRAIEQIEQYCSSPVFYELIQIELDQLDKISYAVCQQINLKLQKSE